MNPLAGQICFPEKRKQIVKTWLIEVVHTTNGASKDRSDDGVGKCSPTYLSNNDSNKQGVNAVDCSLPTSLFT